MTKDPIEIGRTRRPMECALTEAERKQRSDQVHGELEMRERILVEQARLDAEAKSFKEQAKVKEESVKQIDLRIRDLSQAARTGRETRPVDVVLEYDPAAGEVIERRADTGEEVLRRQPTSEEWDAIKRPPLPGTEPPPRRPRDVPGINTMILFEQGDPLTFDVLGEAIGKEDRGTVRDPGDAYVASVVASLCESADRPISLTAAEMAQLREGLLKGLEGPGPLTEQVQANIASIEAGCEAPGGL